MATQQSSTVANTDAASYLDMGITLAINNWPALTLAVQSNWGGPNSADKRAWLCGAISDMIADRPETDAEDLEDVLIQVMNDEFDAVVDDESAAKVGTEIMEMRAQTGRGEFAEIQAQWDAWQKKSEEKAASMFKQVESKDEDQETDDEADEDDAEDVEMGDAPAPREKVEPEIDEDGFTKVVGKKRR
ncbi:hypothetical protein N7468_007066 [Penicillium chermesinum]|uniref:Pre-rRNA processing protein n=1 Tax=Penicillium chermesinum TaxID=63820 RepID=A0A9W9NTE4_9EURO|nr:uncharacterized protein N7468_007066 [Penicillium chermesinum]KAJ5225841.1 hypothetical protein N7468_007066 [Penicillium chermesinum]KAJ6160953.1 hypothetical protein N7470_004349 [Penicillium chermesinum]